MIQRPQIRPWVMVLWFILLLPLSSPARLVVVSSDPVPAVFGGGPRQIRILVRNPAQTTATVQVQYQILQTATALAAPASGLLPWKRLTVLPEQTIVDLVPMSFPLVGGETRYVVRWLDAAESVLGTTEVLVYPTNLLFELKPLADGRSLGLFDPDNQIKPLLREMNAEFDDLENSGLEHFTGRLAVLGPFAAGQPSPAHLVPTSRRLAKTGVNLVFLTPMEPGSLMLEPATTVAGFGTGTIVVCRSVTLNHFDENPLAQLNLVRLARLAVKRDQPDLLISTP